MTTIDADIGWKPLPRFSRREFNMFRELISEHCGIKVPDNKQLLLKNRIGKRVKALGCKTYTEYYQYVTSGTTGKLELGHLWSVVTTHQTYFFREPNHFRSLQHTIIPQLNKKKMGRVTAWSAGCSSGEEAYTLAAILHSGLDKDCKISILATDIDKQMIQTAKAGIYPLAAQKHIPPHFLGTYFDFSATELTATPMLKDIIAFKPHNLHSMSGIPGRYDVIFCRNVIMYFEKEFRQELIPFFHRHLKDDGYLFVGSSESLQGLPRMFEPVRVGPSLVYRKTKSQGGPK